MNFVNSRFSFAVWCVELCCHFFSWLTGRLQTGIFILLVYCTRLYDYIIMVTIISQPHQLSVPLLLDRAALDLSASHADDAPEMSLSAEVWVCFGTDRSFILRKEIGGLIFTKRPSEGTSFWEHWADRTSLDTDGRLPAADLGYICKPHSWAH